MKCNRNQRRGTVAVLTAVCLVVLLSFAAIALDGGLLQYDERAVQSAADASALAAADDLFANFLTNKGADPSGTAVAKARAAASANGFADDGTNAKVTVNIPPASGMHQGQNGYAEVIVEYYQPRGFSVLWGSDKITVRGRAVAIGMWDYFRDGIMVLDPTNSGALTDNGSGGVTVTNADVIVDSNSPSAAISSGGGLTTALNFYITGVPGTSTSGGGKFNGNIIDNQMPTPDPLAYLTPPDPDSMTVQSKNSTTLSGNSSKTVTVYPGVYKGGIKVSGQVTLVMEPGIYYMDGGGFSFTGQGSLTAEGVMIYSAPKSNSDVININGNGTIDMTPLTSGQYQGLSLWQERSSTNTVYLTGNGTSQLYGAVYAQHGLMNVSGNGSQDVLGSQYVSYDVKLGGNGSFAISWRQDMTARTRKIYLVE